MDGYDIYGSVLDSTCVASTNNSVNCVPHECAIKKGQYLEGIYIIISFQRDGCIVAKMISLELTKFL